MEYAEIRLNTITSTLHHPGHPGGNPDVDTTTNANAKREFHIYTLEWKETEIKIYVDNQLFFKFFNSANVPFNQSFFLIFN